MFYKLKDYIAISGSGVLFNTQTGESFSVNELGMFIIELIRKYFSREQIKECIYEEYLIDEKTLENHLEDFLAFLEHHHLVELVP